MITDQAVISRIASRWTARGLFAAEWMNLAGGWAIDHFERYGKPIGRQIKSVFERWADDGNQSESIIIAIESLLQSVSDDDERETDSDDYLIDLAGSHFNRVAIQRTIDEAEQALDAGNTDEAYRRVGELNRVELGAGSFVKPAEEFPVWDKAFDPEKAKSLVTYKGPLGNFMQAAFCRGRLYAFQASDKVGKSFFLLDLAYRAVRDRLRVAYFEVGDLGLDDTMIRLGQRATRRMVWPGTCKVPLRFDRDKKLVVEDRVFKNELTSREAYKAFHRICRGKDRFRLSCHANSTINVAGIESILSDWDRVGWRPDIVCCDYADILAPPDGFREKIDQIDQTWKALRRLSQQRHVLVVTATQTKATAYTARGGIQGRQHFSGSKAKLAEANGIIALNQTSDESKSNMWRLSWIVHRNAANNEASWVNVAGCLAIGCPVLVSGW